MADQDQPLPRHARGTRPHFFDDPALDQMMSVLLEVVQEVSVLADRVDAMQRLLDRNGTLTRSDLENYRPDATAEGERQRRREEYLQRIFRTVRGQAAVFSTGQAEEHLRRLEASLDDDSSV
ncbi:MAG TPA: hypothetical protein VFR59_13760 [Steroidobacteraceae bacterium]|nr:hypothetical protein [Steroidobacteraceae bacterium]